MQNLTKGLRQSLSRQLQLQPLTVDKIRPRPEPRTCNLCGQCFNPSSSHVLFCDCCKKKSATYRFSEWMSAA